MKFAYGRGALEISQGRQMKRKRRLKRIKRTGSELVASIANLKVRGKSRIVIPLKHLETLKTLQTLPFELGGYIDFDEKHRHRMISYWGDHSSVGFPTLDYEIEFHTHPSAGLPFSPPSGADIIGLLENAMKLGTQIALICAKEGIYVIHPTEELIETYSELSEKEQAKMERSIVRSTDKAFDEARSHGDIEKFYRSMEDNGFSIKKYSYGRQLPLLINIVE